MAAALWAWARGLFRAEAAVELLIGHGFWLCRNDFLDVAVEFGRGVVDGSPMAAVDWERAAAALEAGRLPCSDSEAQMLRLAVSIADGVPLDLGRAVSGLDEHNIVLVAAAMAQAAGHREIGVPHGT
ncbi:MAG: hypothetical protein GEU78_18715, partial [Actinobacteria bacterium]|nr:hypothetical protein [Actinomycetota bacterium]